LLGAPAIMLGAPSNTLAEIRFGLVTYFGMGCVIGLLTWFGYRSYNLANILSQAGSSSDGFENQHQTRPCKPILNNT